MKKTTEKTLHYLQTNGFRCCIVERWVPMAGDWKRGRRIDAFGFGDILAMRAGDVPGVGSVVLVQSCAGSGHAAHKAKILALPDFKLWKRSGGDVLLISWSKKKVVSSKFWTPRVELL
jgi:hypothetical protein